MTILITRIKKKVNNHPTTVGNMYTYKGTQIRMASTYLFATLNMMKKFHSLSFQIIFPVAFLSWYLAGHIQVSVMPLSTILRSLTKTTWIPPNPQCSLGFLLEELEDHSASLDHHMTLNSLSSVSAILTVERTTFKTALESKFYGKIFGINLVSFINNISFSNFVSNSHV